MILIAFHVFCSCAERAKIYYSFSHSNINFIIKFNTYGKKKRRYFTLRYLNKSHFSDLRDKYELKLSNKFKSDSEFCTEVKKILSKEIFYDVNNDGNKLKE
jgi:hypothetical protein